ncbi:MAG TPA: hypothetical protein VHP38_00840 [Ruminiclostridium sp.]|nr:hypothetical protein [Ruminiclostridium sp.]
MQLTKNYDFKKPGGADLVNVDDLNANFDNIDEALTPAADSSQVPTADGPAKLSQWISWLTNRIKAITGKDKWYEAPDTALSDIVSAAAANKVLKLDDNAKLPASITGDADTLDGKHADAFALENHTHPAPFSIKTGTVRDQMKIAPTPGYQNHKYMVSIASIDTYGNTFNIPLATAGSYPNYYTVASDTTRVGYICTVDEATLTVTARALADNNTWVAGYANYIEIAWN